MQQDPRPGSYPLADEANKWGMYVDQFLQAWKEARQLGEPAKVSAYCRPPFAVALSEFWYVLGEDDEFVAFYRTFLQEPAGSRPTTAGPLSPDEMSTILSRAKAVINRTRSLWGYPRAEVDEPFKVTKRRVAANGSS